MALYESLTYLLSYLSTNCVCLWPGRRHVGKVVYTDNEEVLIWYECELIDVSGACVYGRSRLEILQRTRNANGNLYLVHRDLVRSLCLDPKLLQLVTHHGKARRPSRHP